MEQQKNFSKAAFGGLKKEEVLEYINIMNTNHETDMADCKAELDETRAQLAEFKTIVEEQYAKIVDATELSEASIEQVNALKAEKAEIASKNEALESKLKSTSFEQLEKEQIINELKLKLDEFLNAEKSAKEIVEKAQVEAQAAADDMKRKLMEASSQVKIMVDQATTRTNGMLLPAKSEADGIVSSARVEAGTILSNARTEANDLLSATRLKANALMEDAKIQIENTISLNEENEEKARRLVDAARREADEIIRLAKLSAADEKSHCENSLKALEANKNRLLSVINEVKDDIAEINIGYQPKSEKELFNSFRESTSEAIRKKFTMMNNRERKSGQNNRY